MWWWHYYTFIRWRIILIPRFTVSLTHIHATLRNIIVTDKILIHKLTAWSVLKSLPKTFYPSQCNLHITDSSGAHAGAIPQVSFSPRINAANMTKIFDTSYQRSVVLCILLTWITSIAFYANFFQTETKINSYLKIFCINKNINKNIIQCYIS